MARMIQVSSYVSRAPDLSFMCLDVRVAEIAERAGFRLETWEEDGLGPASGMFIRLPTGAVVLLRELKHAVEHLGARGPTVWTTADKLAEAGVEPLVAEVLESLELPRDAAYWTAPESLQEIAAKMNEMTMRDGDQRDDVH
jgi:hypothetical protein